MEELHYLWSSAWNVGFQGQFSKHFHPTFLQKALVQSRKNEFGLRAVKNLLFHPPVDSILTQREFPQKWKTLGPPLTSMLARNIFVKTEASMTDWPLFWSSLKSYFFNKSYEVSFCFLGQTRYQSKRLETISQRILSKEILHKSPSTMKGLLSLSRDCTITYVHIWDTKNLSRKILMEKYPIW